MSSAGVGRIQKKPAQGCYLAGFIASYGGVGTSSCLRESESDLFAETVPIRSGFGKLPIFWRSRPGKSRPFIPPNRRMQFFSAIPGEVLSNGIKINKNADQPAILPVPPPVGAEMQGNLRDVRYIIFSASATQKEGSVSNPNPNSPPPPRTRSG